MLTEQYPDYPQYRSDNGAVPATPCRRRRRRDVRPPRRRDRGARSRRRRPRLVDQLLTEIRIASCPATAWHPSSTPPTAGSRRPPRSVTSSESTEAREHLVGHHVVEHLAPRAVPSPRRTGCHPAHVLDHVGHPGRPSCRRTARTGRARARRLDSGTQWLPSTTALGGLQVRGNGCAGRPVRVGASRDHDPGVVRDVEPLVRVGGPGVRPVPAGQEVSRCRVRRLARPRQPRRRGPRPRRRGPRRRSLRRRRPHPELTLPACVHTIVGVPRPAREAAGPARRRPSGPGRPAGPQYGVGADARGTAAPGRSSRAGPPPTRTRTAGRRCSPRRSTSQPVPAARGAGRRPARSSSPWWLR